MAGADGPNGRLAGHFTAPGLSSFVEFLRVAAPDMLPGTRLLPAGESVAELAPHGTTVVAAAFDGGVVMAGDRRATMGNLIAERDVEKVYPADDYSVIGIAGTMGVALEIVRLFQVELEHYEKIEGTPLTLEGKANRLSTMIRGNLGAAMQGLAVVPLFAGVDMDADDPGSAGRIMSYDITGGRHEQRGYHAVGSGSLFARSALKKRWRAGASQDETVTAVIESLYDAADEDSATGGPDMVRRIYPLVMVVTSDGAVRLGEETVGGIVETVLANRTEHPGG
ncbi:MAG: proteasome subunit beta [Actinobacteria bacterium]|nr:proteasome subunit beta [Actinomycetota bacterium]